MYITIDDYYSIDFYNESLEALKNNGIIPKEFIQIKSPYNWYIDVPHEPIMINYDTLAKTSEKWLVNKVQAIRENEKYLLLRRPNENGSNALLKYIENEPLKESRLSDFSIFFDARGAEQLEQITRDIPVKIWYFGKYKNNKIRLCMCNNKMILNYIDKEQILLQKESSEPGRFESELNFKIFRGTDMLEKYTETAYFKDGLYHRVKIKSDRVTTI